MTDKVQKIREEVERLHNEYRNKKGALYFRKALRTVLFIIDSLSEERVNGRMCGYEVEFDTLSAQAAVKGMDVPDSLRIGVKYTGRKRLTDEQRSKLSVAINDTIMQMRWQGIDFTDSNEFDDLMQEYLIEPFIEPLINGEI